MEIHSRASIGPLVRNNTGSMLLLQLLNAGTPADTITGTSIRCVQSGALKGLYNQIFTLRALLAYTLAYYFIKYILTTIEMVPRLLLLSE